MKRSLAALGLGAMLVAGTAQAGGLVAEMPPAVIVDDTSDNSHDILVPILALIFLAAAVRD